MLVLCRSICSFGCPFVIGLFVSAVSGEFISSKLNFVPEEILCPFHAPKDTPQHTQIVQSTYEVLVCDAELFVSDIVTLSPFC
jgi:hypothetical protein